MRTFDVSDKVVCVKLPKVPGAFGLELHKVYTVCTLGVAYPGQPTVCVTGLAGAFNPAFFADLEEVQLANQLKRITLSDLMESEQAKALRELRERERREGYHD